MSDLNSLLEFYICGCGILSCAVFGLFGNISTILMLKYRTIQMNQTFTNLIVWLAVIDSLFLVRNKKSVDNYLNRKINLQVFVSLSFSLPSLSPLYKERIFPLILPSLLPLTSVTLSGSVYCVIALAVERYLHLSRPQASNKVRSTMSLLWLWRVIAIFISVGIRPATRQSFLFHCYGGREVYTYLFLFFLIFPVIGEYIYQALL
jgi:hypothetical protein